MSAAPPLREYPAPAELAAWWSARLPQHWRHDLVFTRFKAGLRARFRDAEGRERGLEVVLLTADSRCLVRGRTLALSYLGALSGAGASPELADYRRVLESLAAEEPALLRWVATDERDLAPAPAHREPEEVTLFLPETTLLRQRLSLPGGLRESLRRRLAAASAGGRRLQLQLYLERRCGQACQFCPVPRDRATIRGRAHDALLRLHYASGLDLVSSGGLDAVLDAAAGLCPPATLCVTGHDWAAHPELEALLDRLAAERRVPLRFVGPSTRLADPALAARVAALPMLRGLSLTVQSADDAAHDAMVGAPGAAATVRAAIENLIARGVLPEINVVLTARAVAGLGALLERLDASGLRAYFVMFYPLGYRGSWSAAELLAPMDALRAALGRAPALADRVVASLVGVPFCAVPAPLWPRVYPAWTSSQREPAAFPRGCEGCSVRESCAGVPATYAAHFGGRGLTQLP